MDASFDIFWMGYDGSLSWIEVAATLSDATARAKFFEVGAYGECVILSRPTGEITFVRPVGRSASPPLSAFGIGISN